MYGRSCTCLLAISILLLAPASLRGQSGHVDPAPEFAIPLPPNVSPNRLPENAQPPALGPFWPRFPITPPGSPPGLIDLRLIAHAAGTIFSGTVISITRRPATRGQTVETVAITFHIENAIRGATPGEDFTVSQWIGLWSGGQRYRVGERVLLFLYPPSKLGLTSSVAGPMGRFTLDRWGRVLLSAQHLSAFRTDPVLGGKSRVRFSDFALAVQRASEEE
jgi:hypothetical protein